MNCQLQTIVNIDKQAFYEAAKYYTEINMCYNTNPFIMNNDAWNKLSANQQAAVVKASFTKTPTSQPHTPVRGSPDLLKSK